MGGGHYYEYISLTGNYFRKMSIKVEDRNADEHTKADIKASEGSEMFYKVLIGKANKSNYMYIWERLLGTDICCNKLFWKIKCFFFFFFKHQGN